MDRLIQEIEGCTLCAQDLPFGPRPVFRANPAAEIAIIGQAPGKKVHNTGIPWNDPSGDLLRQWLEMDKDQFYHNPKLAIIPMGFCYPGTGKSGDLPPRPECAKQWHQKLWDQMPNIKLTILIGSYAQKYYLGATMEKNLTETVANYKQYLPRFLPLPHPSPRNRFWFTKNPWFNSEVLPALRSILKS
jgi:uracil-DNA glycosylase